MSPGSGSSGEGGPDGSGGAPGSASWTKGVGGGAGERTHGSGRQPQSWQSCPYGHRCSLEPAAPSSHTPLGWHVFAHTPLASQPSGGGGAATPWSRAPSASFTPSKMPVVPNQAPQTTREKVSWKSTHRNSWSRDECEASLQTF